MGDVRNGVAGAGVIRAPISEESWRKIAKLYAYGLTYTQLAHRFGVSYETIRTGLRRREEALRERKTLLILTNHKRKMACGSSDSAISHQSSEKK